MDPIPEGTGPQRACVDATPEWADPEVRQGVRPERWLPPEVEAVQLQRLEDLADQALAASAAASGMGPGDAEPRPDWLRNARKKSLDQIGSLAALLEEVRMLQNDL